MMRVTGGARSGAGAVRNLRDHLAAVVVAARLTDVVRQLELAAVWTFAQIHGTEAMVRPAHVAPGLRNLSLRDSHDSKPRSARRSSPRMLVLQPPQRGEGRVRRCAADSHIGTQRLGLNGGRAGRPWIGIEGQAQLLGEYLAQDRGRGRSTSPPRPRHRPGRPQPWAAPARVRSQAQPPVDTAVGPAGGWS